MASAVFSLEMYNYLSQNKDKEKMFNTFGKSLSAISIFFNCSFNL